MNKSNFLVSPLLDPFINQEVETATKENRDVSFKNVLTAVINHYETLIADEDYAVLIQLLSEFISAKNSRNVDFFESDKSQTSIHSIKPDKEILPDSRSDESTYSPK